MRVYRIYRELELNLRIKPRKRLKREKPDELVVPEQPNDVWSMDFMANRLGPSRDTAVQCPAGQWTASYARNKWLIWHLVIVVSRRLNTFRKCLSSAFCQRQSLP
jgi:hypothetical protein